MRQRALLCLLDIAEQAARRSDGERQPVDTEAAEIARAEETVELTLGRIAVEMPRWPLAQARQAAHELGPHHIFTHQRFRRLQARQFRSQLFGGGHLAEQETAAAEIHPG